ncbi:MULTISPECIES: hypothetical protein [Lactobacillus]|uniref:Uncharacterized protein n=1 Tax=Lactobacillus xujianguonis TaxID=2495899 RepID=A0A437SVT8_9LACO|nr:MULTISPECIES: hypothetical protein [Lactobacillus]RVU71033.1 hypothetical protein EJK17_04055 [Lactobacillus xujianguonis]RVU76811.1 hypothetical protein EJK20_04070 [Lactobacillus xujianguonis]
MNNLKIDAKMQQNMLQAMQLIENDDDNIETKRAILSTAKKYRCANAQVEGHPLSTLYLENDAIQDLV